MSEQHNQPPFKAGDQIRSGGILAYVASCYKATHYSGVAWIVETLGGTLLWAKDCQLSGSKPPLPDHTTELAELRKQLSDLQTRLDDSIRMNNAIRELLAARNDRVEQLESQLSSRDARIAELEAAAGAMRKLLLGYRGWFERSGDIRINQAAEIYEIDAVTSSTAGRDFAEKVKALEAERDQYKAALQRIEGIAQECQPASTQLAKAVGE